MRRVREIILGADDRMTERVQYGTITFACKDNMASFVQVANKHVTLMFNRGQLIQDKAKHPHLEGTVHLIGLLIDDADPRLVAELES